MWTAVSQSMPCKEVLLGNAHRCPSKRKKEREREEGRERVRGKKGKNLNSWFKKFGKNFTTGTSSWGFILQNLKPQVVSL